MKIMSNTIQSVLDSLNTLFAQTDQVLSEWSGEGNLQFPVLLGMMAVKLNWDEKQVREHDPIVRYYVRNNPDWHVTRGAHGGIMKASDKQKKDTLKSAKEAAKAQMQAALEAKVASAAAASNPVTDVADDFDQTE